MDTTDIWIDPPTSTLWHPLKTAEKSKIYSERHLNNVIVFCVVFLGSDVVFLLPL